MRHAKQKAVSTKTKVDIQGRRMDYWLIVYIVVSVVLGAGVSGFLYKRQQTVGAILCFILLLLIFVFYGLRWFSGGNLKGSEQGGVAWPPIVNACPDFMASYTSTDASTGANKVYCYDKDNIYKLKNDSAITAGGYTSLTGMTSTKGFVNLDTTFEKSTLKEDTGAEGKRWPLLKSFQDSSSLSSLAATTLRWEGVWDGRNATPEKASPLPSLN